MKKNTKNNVRRRGFLKGAGTASGVLMLQALATGIPAKVLLDPLSASADDNPSGRLLILLCSRDGDPINCNVPGTYIPGVDHAPAPSMAETTFKLGSQTVSGAKVWSELPQSTLDRMLFFHHITDTPVHGDQARVQRMMDNTKTNDMLVSLIASELAPVLGTTQAAPLTLGAVNGGELFSTQGRLLANVSPLSVKQALAGDVGVLKELTDLRDKQIDKLYALYKEKGTKEQIALLDSWAKSREDVRNISQALTGRLQAIAGNDEVEQVKTAAVLAAMKIAPVISVHVDFGGDNHNDAGLVNEIAKHSSGVQTMQTLVAELDQLRTEGHLPHEVTIASLNVFGRTLKTNGVGGRDHNRYHHTMICLGDGVKPGVIGGIHEVGGKFRARAIDSTTGAASESGDIAFEDTLLAAGKTLAALTGVANERIEEMIPVANTTAKVVQSALG
jgi:uncharacterized protein (DUF1501 family)